MGYDKTNTNDKAVIGVAIASAITLVGLIPVFHSYFDSTIGARQQVAVEQGTYRHWVLEEGGRTAVITAESARNYSGPGTVRRISDGQLAELRAEIRLQQGRMPIDRAMAQIASGQRGSLRPQQNDTTDAVDGWNQIDHSREVTAIERARAEETARQEAERLAAEEAAAAEAAEGSEEEAP